MKQRRAEGAGVKLPGDVPAECDDNAEHDSHPVLRVDEDDAVHLCVVVLVASYSVAQLNLKGQLGYSKNAN